MQTKQTATTKAGAPTLLEWLRAKEVMTGLPASFRLDFLKLSPEAQAQVVLELGAI